MKLPLILIILIGVLTPLASTALFFFWRPAAQVNIGEVLPPMPLETDSWRSAAGDTFTPQAWRGDWVLLTASGGECDSTCRRRLCQMRQLRLMLPGNYLRLRRAWLITDNQSPPDTLEQTTDCGEWNSRPTTTDEHDSTRTPSVSVDSVDTLAGVETLHAAATTLPPAAAGISATEYLYLIDPAGIWVMRFAPELTTYQIRKDMKRLLRISKGRKPLKP